MISINSAEPRLFSFFWIGFTAKFRAYLLWRHIMMGRWREFVRTLKFSVCSRVSLNRCIWSHLVQILLCPTKFIAKSGKAGQHRWWETEACPEQSSLVRNTCAKSIRGLKKTPSASLPLLGSPRGADRLRARRHFCGSFWKRF